jgi:polyhydroxyalkanoate synthase
LQATFSIRFHILDLNPKKSVVRNLLASGGLDIYVLDWGYPDNSDDHLSIEDYLSYIDDSVKVIKEQTGEDKVSIMGYCWGGLFALIYSALNNNDVRNLVLMAVPEDFNKYDTILTKWSKVTDLDRMMDELGHMNGQMLDLAFLMHNPSKIWI